jgi:hypothetical protein
MGSLSSRPTVPAAPQIISQPITQTPAAPVTPLVAAPAIDPVAQESARRTQSLLRRNRGITGTIQSGFRGLLAQSENAAQRKTLLGE